MMLINVMSCGIESSWNFIFQLFVALGSLATFVVLFRKDKGKQRQINALERQIDIAEKKLRLSVKPDLYLSDWGDNQNKLTINLSNKGKTARLLEYRLNSEDIELHSTYLSCDLDEGKSRHIYGKPKGNKYIKDCRYEITIVYVDRLDNKYETVIKGVGANAKIADTREVQNETKNKNNKI